MIKVILNNIEYVSFTDINIATITIRANKDCDIFFDKSQKKIYSVSQDTYVKYWYIDPEDIFKLLKN